MQHTRTAQPTKADLSALRKQLRALNSGHVALIAAKCNGEYTESMIRYVLLGKRKNAVIVTAAMDLLDELRKERAKLSARIKRTTTIKAA